MLTADFDYQLPKTLIAQTAPKHRDRCRLLLLDKKSGEIRHDYFYHLKKYLKPGDVLVLNDSFVFPARLHGKKVDTNGKLEVFLLKQIDKFVWQVMIGGKAKEGIGVVFDKALNCTVEKNNEDGTWLVRFNLDNKKFFSVINKIGEVPLPPYIKRVKNINSDKKSYQNIFANQGHIGSVAAPTAGLHFTAKLLKELVDYGVVIAKVTLHVGLGTFAPVKVADISDHQMHYEHFEVKASELKKIANAKRVIAVGTTSLRVLESLGKNINSDQDISGDTNIFICPGYKFKVVDALITNFHLPKSTLLMLVSALAGKATVLRAYQEAIKLKYHFFSYGDAMFICRFS